MSKTFFKHCYLQVGLPILLLLGLLSSIATSVNAQDPNQTERTRENPSTRNQTDSTREGEAKQYIAAVNRAQQAYYLQNGKFATSMQQLGLGLQGQTQNYRYRIVLQRQNSDSISASEQPSLYGQPGDRVESVMMIAVPRRPALKSYTGGVFATISVRATSTRAVVCETAKPSASPPIPQDGRNQSGQITCPAGSRLLRG